MGEISYLNQDQDDVVKHLEALLEKAKDGDIKCLYSVMILGDDVLAHGRTGLIEDGEAFSKLIGGLEHQKHFLLRSLSLYLDETEEYIEESFELEEIPNAGSCGKTITGEHSVNDAKPQEAAKILRMPE